MLKYWTIVEFRSFISNHDKISLIQHVFANEGIWQKSVAQSRELRY